MVLRDAPTPPPEARSVRLKIRDARDSDGEQLARLIEACYGEYDGCILDIDGEAPELREIATYHAGRGGRFWVAENDGRILGSVGIVPGADGAFEMKKLYVTRDARKMGVGKRLVSLAEAEAMSRDARAIDLWSDTRFEDAHRLYERRGYVRGPKTRALNDKSKSVEYYFRRELPGSTR